MGLNAVLADGTILNDMKTVRKDNTGFDLKQLFIGSEGVLGIITDVCILTPIRPLAKNVCLLQCASFEQAISIFNLAKIHLGESLSACEYFDMNCMNLVVERYNKKNPFNNVKGAFFVLVESSGMNFQHDEEKMKSFLEVLIKKSCCEDGILASSESQVDSLWSLREFISPALRSEEYFVLKYDVSIHSSLLNQATRHVEKVLLLGVDGSAPEFVIYQYGHLGDSNLHFNCRVRKTNKNNDRIRLLIEKELYSFVRKNNGSISAEHGLGQLKADKISYSKSKGAVEKIKQIKKMFDEHNILNPGKVIQV